MCIYKFLLLLLLLYLIYLIYTLFSTKQTNLIKPIKSIKKINLIKPIKQIQIYENFISDSKCNKLIKLAKNRYENSQMYKKKSNFTNKNARSSSCAYFKPQENKLIKYIELKAAKYLGIDPNKLEPLQIVKYKKGQEYKYHYDYFDKKSDQTSNQRVHTILVYLNSLNKKDGGKTAFPKFNKKITPKKGLGVSWFNLLPNGKLNKKSLHAGEPVKTNKNKYVLTIWSRIN